MSEGRPMTEEQRRMLGKLAEGKVSRQKAMPVIGHLTADDLELEAERATAAFETQKRRHDELKAAADELVRLMREHGCTTPGELADLGIRLAFVDLASRFVAEHDEGLISDDELRELGVARGLDGEIVLAVSPLAFVAPEGHG